MNTSATLIPAYTPLETLLLFQSLHQQGISPATFVSISELLKNNSFIKDSPTYNPGRLSPDALQNLFQQLLRDELRSGGNGGGSGEGSSGNGTTTTATGAGNTTTTTQRRDVSLSPNSKKRKLPSPSLTPLPTLEEAQRHTDKLPPLINRLYARYRDHAIQEIQREEATYVREAREYGEIVRGDWDDRIRREESRAPSRNGTTAPPVGGVASGQRPSGVRVGHAGVAGPSGSAPAGGGIGGGHRQPTPSRPAPSPSPVPLPVHSTQAQAQAQAQAHAPSSASTSASPLLNGPQRTSASPQLPKQSPVPTPRAVAPDRRTSIPPPPVPTPTPPPMPAGTGASGHPTLPAATSPVISRPIPSSPAQPGTPTIKHSPPAPPGPPTTVQHPQKISPTALQTSGPRPPVTAGQQSPHPPPPQPHTQAPPQASVPAAHQQGPRPPYQPPQQKTPIPYPQHPHHHPPIQPAPGPGSGPQPPQHHISKAQGQKHNAPVLQHPQQASSPYAQKSSLAPGAPQLPSDLARRQEGAGKPKQGTQGQQQPHAPTQLKWEPVVTPGASQHRQGVHPGHGTHPPPHHHPQQYPHPGLRNPQTASQGSPTQGIASPHLQPPRPPPPPTTLGTTAQPHPVLVAPSHPHPGSPLQPLHPLPPQAHQPQQQQQQQQTSRPVVTPTVPQQQERPHPPTQQPQKPSQQPQPPYYPQYPPKHGQHIRPPLAPVHTQPPSTSSGPVATAPSPIQPSPPTVAPPAVHPPPPPKPPVQPPQQPAAQPQQQQQQPQQRLRPTLQQPLQQLRQQVQPPTQVKPPLQAPLEQPAPRVSQAAPASASPAQHPGRPSALNSPFPRPGPPVPEHIRHASTPAGARPRLPHSLPETPVSQVPTPLVQTGTGTRWAANPTPGTPRPGTGAVASPSVVPLSPVLRLRQTPLSRTELALAESSKKPGSTPLETSRDIGKKPPKSSSEEKQPETAKEADEKEEEEETKEPVTHPKKQPALDKVDTARSSRRPSRGATRNRPTIQAVTRTRRSKSVASTAEEASPAPPDVAAARIKEEVSTPRIPDDTDDATADESQPQTTPSRAPSQRHRLGKRKRQESTDVPTPNIIAPTTPPSHVMWTRGFPKVSASVLDQIASHRYANMFADKIKARDAPRYHDIVTYPQDLRKIRSAIHAGNKAATHALHNMAGGDPGTPSVWLPWDESLVPPKGIINTEQLECELVHMFSNAIMYNPDPFRGPGPGFRKVWQREEDERTGVLGYMNEPDVVVKDTRNMYVEVEKLLSELRSAEKDQPPLPPGASGIFTDAHLNSVARSLAEANSRAASASRERTVATEDDQDELATDPETVNREHRAKRRKA